MLIDNEVSGDCDITVVRADDGVDDVDDGVDDEVDDDVDDKR